MRPYLFKHPFLFVPLIALAFLFVLDKVFLLPVVRDNFVQPGGLIYYRQREDQLVELKRDLGAGRRDLVVVLGDSRALGIGDMMSANLPERYRSYRIYNFAGPQAVPAYHDYLSERMLAGANRPRYVILGISPDAFHRNIGIFGSPVMNFGLSHEFIQANRTHIPEQDFDIYRNSRRFALMGMGFSFRALVDRLPRGFGSGIGSEVVPEDPEARRALVLKYLAEANNESLSHYRIHHSPVRRILDMGRGAQFSWTGRADDDELRDETMRLRDFYLKGFRVSHEQFYYFTRTVERLNAAGVEYVVFWPRVNPYLRAEIDEDPRIRAVWQRVREITRANGGVAVDLNNESSLTCDDYNDASHLSVQCFPEVQRLLFDRLAGR